MKVLKHQASFGYMDFHLKHIVSLQDVLFHYNYLFFKDELKFYGTQG